jgi:TolA-binding protein
VADGYHVLGSVEETAERYERARSYYDEWLAEWPGTPTAQAAMSFKVEAFTHEERWEEAARAYERYDREYGDPENRAAVWLSLADIYGARLSRRDLARSYYLRVEEAYRDEIPGAAAAISLARDDIAAGKHGAARARLSWVISKFAHETRIAATAMHELATSYELSGEWDRAVAHYNELARDYPTTMYGMTALLHVAERYRDLGAPEAAKAALERAGNHYVRVMRDYPATQAELAARGHLVDTKMAQERWDEAADLLLETAERFPDGAASPVMMLQAADICETRLEDNARAERTLESLVRTYPEGPWANEAARRLRLLRG